MRQEFTFLEYHPYHMLSSSFVTIGLAETLVCSWLTIVGEHECFKLISLVCDIDLLTSSFRQPPRRKG